MGGNSWLFSDITDGTNRTVASTLDVAGVTYASIGAVPTNRTLAINGVSGVLTSNLQYTVTAASLGAITNNQTGVTLSGALTATSGNCVTNNGSGAGLTGFTLSQMPSGVVTNATGITGTAIWTGTAAAFAAMSATNSSTLYFGY